MAQVFVNGVEGTIDADLASGATTISGAFLADLPVVSGTDYVVLTIDPDEASADAEIVHVTAHTLSATTATISRAQEGTSQPASWPSGTKVAASLTKAALDALVASVDAAEAAPNVVMGAYTGNLIGGFITTSYQTISQVDLTIPASWGSYDVVVDAVQTSGTGAGNSLDGQLRADVLGTPVAQTVFTTAQDYQPTTYAAAHKFSGLSVTGTVRFDFQVRTTADTIFTSVPGTIKAFAVRTS